MTTSRHLVTVTTRVLAVCVPLVVLMAGSIGALPATGASAPVSPSRDIHAEPVPAVGGSTVGVTPAAGDQDTFFHGTGSAFEPSSSVTVYVGQPDGQEYVGSYTHSRSTTSSGDFTWTWVWDPGDQFGTYTFRATDQLGHTASTTFSIAPATEPDPEPGSQLMFDTSSAPSYDAMHTWLDSPYRTVGVYVPVAPGTDDRFDKVQANLTPDWVGSIQADGWSVVPIYLGVQAPASCFPYDYWHMSTEPSKARQQGIAAARYAATSVAQLGIPADVPVIYDMEPYDTGCSGEVAAFLDGWTSGLHQARRLSGVYGSTNSVMSDLALHLGENGYHQPDDVWVDSNNGSATTSGFTAPPDGSFVHHRMNQFHLDVDRTYGGLDMHIDETAINDAVLHSAPPTPVVPTASTAPLPPVTLRDRANYSWSASAVAAVISTYDLRYRVGSPAGSTGAWTYPPTMQGTTKTSATTLLSQGETWCFSVRATDSNGYVSGWSAARCTRRPLDDRALDATDDWTRTRRHGSYLGTVTTTTTAGAALSYRGVLATRIGILVPGDARGELIVSVGGRHARVSLAGPDTSAPRIVWTTTFPLARGSLELRTVGAGPVTVDGVVVAN